MKDKTKTRLKIAGAFFAGAGAMFFIAAKTHATMQAKSNYVNETRTWIDQQNFKLYQTMMNEINPTRVDQIINDHWAQVQADPGFKRVNIVSV